MTAEGHPAALARWLAATGYPLQVEPDTTQEGVTEEGSMTEQPTDFFWEVSTTALTHSDEATGTMMGFPCLRVSGAFFASCDHRTGDLIVKLPRYRVEQLIQAGTGKPFAPAGRTFREWVLVGDRDAHRWAELIDEARAFAGPSSLHARCGHRPGPWPGR